jgi:anti-sigma factor RsiW
MEQELTAYLDGELDAATRVRVETHLGSCPECQGTHALLERGLKRMEGLPAFEPSAGARRAFLLRMDGVKDPWPLRLKGYLKPAVLLPATGLFAAGVVATVVAVHTEGRHRGADLGEGQLELAQNLEVLENYEVLGLQKPEDVEVVMHLRELEKTP